MIYNFILTSFEAKSLKLVFKIKLRVDFVSTDNVRITSLFIKGKHLFVEYIKWRIKMDVLLEKDLVDLKISKTAVIKNIADKVCRVKGSTVSSIEVFAVLGYLYTQGNLNEENFQGIVPQFIAQDTFQSASKDTVEKIKYIIDQLLQLEYLIKKG
ncbi:MAG: hypothetical protein HEQ32_02000 [Vampirovibrio sp.]